MIQNIQWVYDESGCFLWYNSYSVEKYIELRQSKKLSRIGLPAG